MSDFPKDGDISATRAWLDKKLFEGKFINWDAEAILGLDKTEVMSIVPGEDGLRLWSLLKTARQTQSVVPQPFGWIAQAVIGLYSLFQIFLRAPSTAASADKVLLTRIFDKVETLNDKIEDLSNKQKDTKDKIEDLSKNQTNFEIRRLRKEVDCWHSNTRTKSESKRFKDDLVQFYNRSDPNNPNNIFCMLTNLSFPSKYCRASHLIKRKTEGDYMNLYNLFSTSIDNPRNGLLLLEPIELLFDRKELCFLYDPLTQKITSKLLNTNLNDTLMVAEDNTPFNMTYGSIDGQELQFPANNMPLRRVLSLHAKLSFSKALNQGWIQETEDFESYFKISDEAINEPLGIGDLTWQEVHSKVHYAMPFLSEVLTEVNDD